jgi:hypothetical protein
MGHLTVSKGYNIVAIGTVGFLIVLTLILLALQAAGEA